MTSKWIDTAGTPMKSAPRAKADGCEVCAAFRSRTVFFDVTWTNQMVGLLGILLDRVRPARDEEH